MKTFNYKTDTRLNYTVEQPALHSMDDCQSPPYAVEMLFPYLPKDAVIWEPACGDGWLVYALRQAGYTVVATDIKAGYDYFNFRPGFDIQVTNPPYNQYAKFPWFERAYELGQPFALLTQTETLGAKTAQALFRRYGVQIIQPHGRIDFRMPFKGWNGSAQFPVTWFTWGLNLPEPLIVVDFERVQPAQHYPPGGPVRIPADIPGVQL